MTNIETTLLKQMQKMAAALGSMGGTGKDKNNLVHASFKDMLNSPSSGKATSSSQPADEPGPVKKPIKEQGVEEPTEEGKLPVENLEEEGLKPENLVGNPNAVMVMDLFRPEIVEGTVEQAVEAIPAPIPEEAVPEAAMDLNSEMPEMETAVDTNVGAEVSMEQQSKDFGQAMEEAPTQTQEAAQPVETQEAAPEQAVERQAEAIGKPDRPEIQTEVREVRREDGEEAVHGEAVAEEAPVFHETQSVPVKVGERYEAVDTQQPEMDVKLADTIQTAMQAGGERIQIHLAPQNLGSLVIEMTKDASGALQVVLHASNAKAAGVLSQHLDGLHNALLGYGHEEVRVEVQRGQEGQEQHFKQADPDGRNQQQHQQHERQEETDDNGQEFLQKLRLGLFGTDEL